jgi:tetratricopeptide (TPR) repeat protein
LVSRVVARARRAVARVGALPAVRSLRRRLDVPAERHNAAGAPGDRLPSTAAVLLDEIRRARGLFSIEATLAAYHRALGEHDLPSPPLALVRSLIQDNHLAGSEGARLIEDALASLAAAFPRCAEISLERAFLCEDQERFEEAVRFYRQAITGQAQHDIAPNDRSVVDLAGAHLGALLVRLDLPAEAREVWRDTLIRRRDDSIASLGARYALLLRAAGDLEAALDYFVWGLANEEPRWNHPPELRDARALRFVQLRPAAVNATGTTVDKAEPAL